MDGAIMVSVAARYRWWWWYWRGDNDGAEGKQDIEPCG